ncbi:MAG TPA: hypothetical protein PKV38_17915, partial [bacterium]|nr:hypothetical protein [bacterium]
LPVQGDRLDVVPVGGRKNSSLSGHIRARGAPKILPPAAERTLPQRLPSRLKSNIILFHGEEGDAIRPGAAGILECEADEPLTSCVS